MFNFYKVYTKKWILFCNIFLFWYTFSYVVFFRVFSRIEILPENLILGIYQCKIYNWLILDNKYLKILPLSFWKCILWLQTQDLWRKPRKKFLNFSFVNSSSNRNFVNVIDRNVNWLIWIVLLWLTQTVCLTTKTLLTSLIFLVTFISGPFQGPPL